ncbi:hypothetical protein CPC08DRAFT_652285, partial [Agrocybe pediades]
MEYERRAADDFAEGVAAEPVDDYDDVFGDGLDLMDVDLPDDTALSERERVLLEKFEAKLAALSYETCDICLEEGFEMHLEAGVCASCKRDKGDPVKKWSAENSVHPGKYDVPPCLQGLTDMEDMLIARVKSYMQVRWTKG